MQPEESRFEEANRIAHGMLPPELCELDLFGVQREYPTDIIVNPCIDTRAEDEELDASKKRTCLFGEE